jgi:quercetin dioxygenase-like cupin family protein
MDSGSARGVIALSPGDLEFVESYVNGDTSARWESASGHSPSIGAHASGSSIIRVPAGCRLPRHTDSAEETIVTVAGIAEVEVAGRRSQLPTGGVAVVPEGAPHEVRNAGDGELVFVAVYAAPNVVTRYEEVVEPDGSRERHTVQ